MQIAIVHRPWVNTKSNPAARADLDVEVVRRPVAGHLGVAMCRRACRCAGWPTRADCARASSGNRWSAGIAPRSRDAVRPSNTIVHHCSTATAPSAPNCSRCTTTWVPARDVRTAEICDEVSVAHRGRAAGAARCRARRARRRGRAARPPRARRPWRPPAAVNTRITGNTAGTASPVEHRGGLVAGGRRIGRDGLRLEAAGKRAVPRRGHRQLAHPGAPSAARTLYFPWFAW